MSERNIAQLRKNFIKILIKHKEIEPKQQMERKDASNRKREGVKEGKQTLRESIKNTWSIQGVKSIKGI